MTTQTEALKLALEALEAVQPECDDFHHKKKEMHDWSEACKPLERYNQAITAIKEALAQPEQEPVGFVVDRYNGANTPSLPPTATVAWLNDNPKIGQILYANTPPQRTWVGLTWNDVPDEWVGKVAFMEGAKWADKQLKEKNK